MVLHGGFPWEVRVAAETRAAVAAGFDVEVVALLRPGQSKTEVVDGVRAYRIPLKHVHGRGGLGVVLEYVGFCVAATLKLARMSLRRRYDIVQIHNPPDFLALAALGPKLGGAKVILDVHDLAPDMFHMRFAGRPGTRTAEYVLRLIERRVARWSDAVVTVHEPYKRELGERGVDPDKIVVVLNTLPEELLPPARPETGDGSASEFRLVYHGTVTPHYGVETVVDAIGIVGEDVPNLVLDIYGEGDSLSDIARRTQELRLEERVRIHKTLSQRDVLGAVAGASAGVVPNLPVRLNRFALSTKLFEYVALGIPVVSSDLPTIRAYFSGDEIRFFEPGNPAALAEALVDVYKDAAAARQRALAAHARYEEYRWPIQADRYQELLRGLVER
jgi:glycosyltransferase involved in cell wall biosynthesis